MPSTSFPHAWIHALALAVATGLVILCAELSGLREGGVAEPEGKPEGEPVLRESEGGDLPDFRRYEDVGERKAAFFAFLRPIAEAVNEQEAARRERLRRLGERLETGSELSAKEREWVRSMADRYRVPADGRPPREVVAHLLRRVDAIPVSLILAQAAKESAWGTSRFAREGNNLFGQWCFEPGCGIVPARRGEGRSHEVRRFATVRDSVASYVRNLNSHPRYAELRELRARLREEGGPVTGHALAAGLDGYSEQGQAYVESVRDLIRHNDLGAVADVE
ncbi:MAG: glucosaminidase domain-containing protein [Thiohalorhabdus sp.]|uniref:glucosaminidase domain-containing protein n=1 Tax=Thiohalorhabdus sp. TaxID=3094134 RepID=UPI003980277B